MKKLSANTIMILGAALICISNILNFLSNQYPSHPIKFFQGVALGLGAVILVWGIVKKFKSKM
ncbi:MAG: hypothetical protein H6Q13_3220 [Bacteroidetes bacterium]|nr:hypothetical protein [Bacteroidota bacterium]